MNGFAPECLCSVYSDNDLYLNRVQFKLVNPTSKPLNELSVSMQIKDKSK